MNSVWLATCKTQDVDGWHYIDVPVDGQSYMNQEEAQKHCAEGCKPMEIILPTYLVHVIESGFEFNLP